MKLRTEVGLGCGHSVLDVDRSCRPKGHSAQFSAHISSGQMAGCIKMALGMEIGLDSGDIVLDGGTNSPSPKRAAQHLPIFGPCIVAKRLDGSIDHLLWW